MPTITISTTISQTLWNIAKEKHISWSEALARGVLEISNINLPAAQGESYQTKDDLHERTRKIRDALQLRVKELNKDNQDLTEKNVLLENERKRG